MRIDELTPYKSTDIYKVGEKLKSDSIRDIYLDLRDMGYVKQEQLLGSGIFAAVFKRANDPYVIKVFKGDKLYLKYLKYVMQHQDNPHVPTLRGRVMKPYKDSDLYLIRMEELLPLSHASQDDYELYKELREYCYGPSYKLIERFKRLYPKLSLYPKLIEVLDAIKEMNGNIDLHDDNVMYRPTDGELVITDPLT